MTLRHFDGLSAQGERKPKCHVCGSGVIAADADPRNPTCERCKPVRQHVVSMQTGAGGRAIAVCRCGWRSDSSWSKAGRLIRESRIRQHWLQIIRRTCQEYEEAFGAGSAAKDLALSLLACGAFAANLLGLALIWRGGQ